jgi:hypothetical protein
MIYNQLALYNNSNGLHLILIHSSDFPDTSGAPLWLSYTFQCTAVTFLYFPVHRCDFCILSGAPL